jgi:pantetheine-phosphate adenylyltransferase
MSGSSKNILAVYPGSFDPFTLGHMDILKKALRLFDKVVVGVGVSETKKAMFTAEKRVALIEAVLDAEQIKDSVEVRSFKGLTVQFAAEAKASHIIRGLRNSLDYTYEQQMAFTNAGLDQKIQTLFLPSAQNTFHISSTLIRSILNMHGDLNGLVHQSTLTALKG